MLGVDEGTDYDQDHAVALVAEKEWEIVKKVSTLPFC
jgi:hypothetical protein